MLDWTRAQIAIMRPDPHARAVRSVVADLAARPDGATYLATRLSGLWQRYELPGEHPLVGRGAPDLALGDGTRLADHLHAGRALLLDLRDDPELRRAAEGHADRLVVHTTTAADSDLRALLVRPDGYVAGAATDEPAPGPDKYLGLWLGAPARWHRVRCRRAPAGDTAGRRAARAAGVILGVALVGGRVRPMDELI